MLIIVEVSRCFGWKNNICLPWDILLIQKYTVSKDLKREKLLKKWRLNEAKKKKNNVSIFNWPEDKAVYLKVWPKHPKIITIYVSKSIKEKHFYVCL